MRDPSESDAALSTAVSEAVDTVAEVATYNEPFELRKVQLQISSNDQLVAQDDMRVITFHLVKLSGGSPTADWVAGDFTAANTAFVAFWNAMLTYYKGHTALKKISYYKAGPDVSPPQPPVFSSDHNIIGTSGGVDSCPPQVAVTVTEKAGTKPHWGRFYMPAPMSTTLTEYGRIDSVFQTALANAADTLYESLKAAGLPVVVYRPALPLRQTAAEKRAGTTPGSLPARDASAWTVDELQVDDVFDVIRSRRWKNPTLRLLRAIA